MKNPSINIILLLSFSIIGCTSTKDIYIDKKAEVVPIKKIQEESDNNELDDIEREKNDQNRIVEIEQVTGSINKIYQTESVAQKKLQLNFIDTPATEVAKVIINLALNSTLSISDGIDKKITLISPEPVDATIALKALEEVLIDSELALIQTASGYELTTIKNASERPFSIRRSGQFGLGFGVTVHPIKNISASEVFKLINPFLSKTISISHDDTHNLLFLKGTQVEVNSAIEAIKIFDSPWLTDKAFALITVKNAEIDSIIRDVETVLITQGSEKIKRIKIAPLHRINCIFVATNSKQELDIIEKWVARFDVEPETSQRSVFFYQAQYKPASELGTALTNVFQTQQTSARQSDRQESFAPGKSMTPNQVNGTVNIVTDETNDALIIKAQPEDIIEIKSLLKKMDQYTPQVLIEATIAEVILNDNLRYGVQWSRLINGRSTITSATNGSGTIAPQFPGLSYTYSDVSVSAALSALESVSEVTVLSSPSLMVQNNQTAQLQVGDQVPIVTQQAQNTGSGDAPIVSSIQLRDTGVILEVKPRINASDMVSIEVKQEISDVAPTTTSGIDSPTIQQRKVSSTVSIPDGQTIALGGLIREQNTDSNTGVPLFKNIPIIGNFFKSTDKSKRRTELIIFLTPKILREEKDGVETFNRLKEDMKNLTDRLGNVN